MGKSCTLTMVLLLGVVLGACSDPETQGEASDGDSGAGLGEAIITELGSDPLNWVKTNDVGEYSMMLQDSREFDLLAEKEGWNSAILAAGKKFASLPNGGFLELYPTAEEGAVFQQDFGVPYDASLGTVTLRVTGPDGPGAGVAIELDSKHGGAHSLQSGDKFAAGNRVPTGATEGMVTFVLVNPGTAAITVTSPDGWSCVARARVPVLPNVHTTSFVICKD